MSERSLPCNALLAVPVVPPPYRSEENQRNMAFATAPTACEERVALSVSRRTFRSHKSRARLEKCGYMVSPCRDESRSRTLLLRQLRYDALVVYVDAPPTDRHCWRLLRRRSTGRTKFVHLALAEIAMVDATGRMDEEAICKRRLTRRSTGRPVCDFNLAGVGAARRLA